MCPVRAAARRRSPGEPMGQLEREPRPRKPAPPGRRGLRRPHSRRHRPARPRPALDARVNQRPFAFPSCRPRGPAVKALALFSFPSLAAYEQYGALFGNDPDFIEADRIRDDSGCVLRYERTFMRPLLPGHPGRVSSPRGGSATRMGSEAFRLPGTPARIRICRAGRGPSQPCMPAVSSTRRLMDLGRQQEAASSAPRRPYSATLGSA
jgi:hypothetical protein